VCENIMSVRFRESQTFL